MGEHGKCYSHGGKSLKGAEHPNYKHGAFSKHIRESLTEAEQEAVDDLLADLEDPEQATSIVHELIGDAYVKWDRSGDVRFLREIRQLLSEFNVAPSVEQLEVSAQVESEHSLDDETREVVREVLSRRREASDE